MIAPTFTKILLQLKYLDETESADNIPCTVCLGILQDDLLEAAIQKVI